jgi:hypothetical protein
MVAEDNGTVNRPRLLPLLAFPRPTALLPLNYTMLIRRPVLLATRRPLRLLVRPIHSFPQTDRVGQLSLISFSTYHFTGNHHPSLVLNRNKARGRALPSHILLILEPLPTCQVCCHKSRRWRPWAAQ